MENVTSGMVLQPGSVREPGRDRLVQSGVPCAEEAVQLTPTPAWNQVEGDPDDLADGPDLGDRHAADRAALETRDGVLRGLHDQGDIDLSEPLADSDGAVHATDGGVVHGPRIADAAYAGLTRGLRGSAMICA